MSAPPRRTDWRPFWHAVGLTFTVITVLAGIAVVGVFIWGVIAFNSYGSNK
ncbi:MAG TPA: hypothetical protein VGP36_22785 [Mycobacteriales bacterium]|jgi:hypothetical protein|nr:hypothetical protein [Mycobacteriales bacterium]